MRLILPCRCVAALAGWLALGHLAAPAAPATNSLVEFDVALVSRNHAQSAGQLVLTNFGQETMRGYFLWPRMNGVRVLELLTAGFSPDGRTLQMHVNESRAAVDGFSPADYAADLDRATLTLTRGLRWRQSNPDWTVAWLAKSPGTAATNLEPEAADWLADQMDRTRLRRELTVPYRIQREFVHGAPDPRDLVRWRASADPEIADVAGEVLSDWDLQEQIRNPATMVRDASQLRNEAMAFLATEFGADLQKRQSQIEAGQPADGQSFFDVLGDAGEALGGANGTLANSARHGAETSALLRPEAELRKQLRANLLAQMKAAATAPLPADQISLRFSAEPNPGTFLTDDSPGYLVLENNGDQPLHQVTVEFDVNRDADGIDAAWEDEKPQWAMGGLANLLVGADESINTNQILARERHFDALKVGTGGTAFIAVWPPQTKVRIFVDSLYGLVKLTASVRVFLAADEGFADFPALTQQEMRQKFAAALQVQRRTRRPPPTDDALEDQKRRADAAMARAVKQDQDSADRLEASGEFHMGQRYLEGRGVRKDLVQARKYLSAAADQGWPGAAEALAALPAP